MKNKILQVTDYAITKSHIECMVHAHTLKEASDFIFLNASLAVLEKESALISTSLATTMAVGSSGNEPLFSLKSNSPHDHENLLRPLIPTVG